MSGVGLWRGAAACLALSWSGCAEAPIEGDGRCASIEPGDLVVTEVLANPEGADGDREYIELFNASGALVDLDGVVLSTARADGQLSKSHRFVDVWVEAGEYFVVGNAADEAAPAFLDYSYGNALGSLRNSDAQVSLSCGAKLIDRLVYDRTSDGRALELDGALTPNHETNDEPARWCAARTEGPALADGSFGTPGQPNDPCSAEVGFGDTCVEAGELREAVRPSPVDVHIAEWMPNPEGLDADLEWVEVLVSRNVDLQGLQLGPAEDQLSAAIADEACSPVDAGTRVVFGASPAAAPRVDADLDFTLGNTGARSIVVALDGTVLDRVDYEGSTEGRAWQVGASGEVCLASAAHEYALQNFGTPGEPNPACTSELEPGTCLDGTVARAIVHPSAGEARITEWMADPEAVGSRDGEWVEIQLSASVDLNGMSLTDLAGSVSELRSEECIRVPSGTHVVFVRNLVPVANGGIEGAVGPLSLSLNDREETITLSVLGEVLDSVSHARAEPGVATQVDALGVVCAATDPYGDGDLGTPGAANPSCG